MRQRLVWTNEEHTAVATEAARLLADGIKRSQVDTLRLAQKVLPKPRQKLEPFAGPLPGQVYAAAQRILSNEPPAIRPESGHKPGQRNKSTIRWSHEEAALVATEMARIQASGNAPRWGNQLLLAAQHGLPPERQRRLPVPASVVTHMLAAASKITLPPPAASVPEPVPAPAVQLAPLATPPPPQATPPDSIGAAASVLIEYFAKTFTSTLGKVIGDAVGQAVANGIRDALTDQRLHMSRPGYQGQHNAPLNGTSAVTPSAAPPDFGDLPVKFHTPKILILGLLPAQQQEVKHRFPQIDLRFLDGKDSNRTGAISNLSSSSHATFLMTKFISHRAVQSIHGKIVNCNGGITDLCNLIAEHFPQQVLPALASAPPREAH